MVLGPRSQVLRRVPPDLGRRDVEAPAHAVRLEFAELDLEAKGGGSQPEDLGGFGDRHLAALRRGLPRMKRTRSMSVGHAITSVRIAGSAARVTFMP
jgi:hypothetical protein